MTIGGWTIMLVSVGIVTALFTWCLYKVLRTSMSNKVETKIAAEGEDTPPSAE